MKISTVREIRPSIRDKFKRIVLAHGAENGCEIEVVQTQIAKDTFRVDVAINDGVQPVGPSIDSDKGQISRLAILCKTSFVGNLQNVKVAISRLSRRKVKNGKVTKL